jgi:hypothetical protein
MVHLFWTAMNTKVHLHIHPACAAASGGVEGRGTEPLAMQCLVESFRVFAVLSSSLLQPLCTDWPVWS